MPMKSKSKHKTKRKTKRKTRTERHLAEANRIAALITSAPINAGETPAPGLIHDQRLTAARAVWREVVPLLKARHILDDGDRFALALYCYWWGEFVAAADDIARRGYSVLVRTISGDRMPRKNASTSRRDHAFDKISELSTKFGLTPLDRHALQRAAKSASLSDQLPLDGSSEVTAAGGEVAQWDDVADRKLN
jgi:P27 family predicted phage terminase small subunit